MSIDALIYGKLSGTSAVTALVSTRIYPDVLPEAATLPALTFTCSQGPPTYLTDGNIDHIRGTFKCHVIVAENKKLDALAIAAQVQEALDQYATSNSNLILHNTWYDDRGDHYDPATRRHTVTLTFSFWYTPRS